MMKEKRGWIVDLLKLAAMHPLLDAKAFQEAWNIPQSLAVELLATIAQKMKKETI